MTELTVEIVRELLDYNPETGEFRWKKRDLRWFDGDIRICNSWNTRFVGTVAGSINNSKKHRMIHIFSKLYQAHRLAWLHYYGEWPQYDLDHKNHNKDDNRVDNLREVTDSQNKMNGSNIIWGKSKFRGVSWHKNVGKWQTKIQVDGKHIYLGIYVMEEDAARSYDIAALKYFGEYASLNFPIEDYLGVTSARPFIVL